MQSEFKPLHESNANQLRPQNISHRFSIILLSEPYAQRRTIFTWIQQKNGKTNLSGLLFRLKLTAEGMDGLTRSKQTLAGGAETAVKQILRLPLPEENYV